MEIFTSTETIVIEIKRLLDTVVNWIYVTL